MRFVCELLEHCFHVILGICPEIPPKPTNYLNWGGLSDGNISEVLVTPISDGLTGAKGEMFS